MQTKKKEDIGLGVRERRDKIKNSERENAESECEREGE